MKSSATLGRAKSPHRHLLVAEAAIAAAVVVRAADAVAVARAVPDA